MSSEYSDNVDVVKASIGPLEHSINGIYALRAGRPLTGQDSILVRTLGDDFRGPGDYRETYSDQRRGQVQTEFAETMQAMRAYDESDGIENRVALLSEVGDIIAQRARVEILAKRDPDYVLVAGRIDEVLRYLDEQLQGRDLAMSQAHRVARVKYGVRSWLDENGQGGRDDEFENQLAREEITDPFLREGPLVQLMYGKGAYLGSHPLTSSVVHSPFSEGNHQMRETTVFFFDGPSLGGFRPADAIRTNFYWGNTKVSTRELNNLLDGWRLNPDVRGYLTDGILDFADMSIPLFRAGRAFFESLRRSNSRKKGFRLVINKGAVGNDTDLKLGAHTYRSTVYRRDSKQVRAVLERLGQSDSSLSGLLGKISETSPMIVVETNYKISARNVKMAVSYLGEGNTLRSETVIDLTGLDHTNRFYDGSSVTAFTTLRDVDGVVWNRADIPKPSRDTISASSGNFRS